MAKAPVAKPPTARSPPPKGRFATLIERAAKSGKASKADPLTFTAELWSPMAGKGWTFASLPAASSAALGKKGRVPVEATVGGVKFRTSCFPDGDGGHRIQMNGAMRDATGKADGDLVEFSLKVASDDVEVTVPPALAKALKADKGAQGQWGSITPKARAEWVAWIASAKQEETRVARTAKTVERLRSGAKRPSD